MKHTENCDLRRGFLKNTVAGCGLVGTWVTPAILSVSLPSHAQTTPQTCDADVSDSDTTGLLRLNFEDVPLSITQYDGPGSLSKVIVTLGQQVIGAMGIENMESEDDEESFLIILEADITVAFPVTGTPPQTTKLLDKRTVPLLGYDGILDFAGDSGLTFSLDSGRQEKIIEFTDLLDINQFIGSGVLEFLVSAEGTVTVTTAAQQQNKTTTSGIAYIKVDYVCA